VKLPEGRSETSLTSGASFGKRERVRRRADIIYDDGQHDESPRSP